MILACRQLLRESPGAASLASSAQVARVGSRRPGVESDQPTADVPV